MKIELEPGCDIIDARILKVSRTVTQFAKGEVSESAKNTLPLSFTILERNDGAAIQIIYSGRSDTAISLRGTVVGAAGISQLATEEMTFEAQSREKFLRFAMTAGWLLLTAGSFFLGWLTHPWLSLRRFLEPKATRSPFPPLSFGRTIALVLCLTMSGFGLVIERRAVAHLAPGVPQSIWMEQ